MEQFRHPSGSFHAEESPRRATSGERQRPGRVRVGTRRGRCLVVLAAAVVAACEDTPTESAPENLVVTPASLSQSGPPLFQGVLPITDRFYPQDSLRLEYYPTPTLVGMKLSGQTYVYKNWPAADRGQLEKKLNANGRKSGNICHEGLQIRYRNAAWGWNFWPGNNACSTEGDSTPVVTGFAVLRDTAKAFRNGPIAYNLSTCDGGQTPCKYYKGELLISLIPVDAELTVVPNPATLTAPALVTFTASLTPDMVEGITVPRQVMKWQ